MAVVAVILNHFSKNLLPGGYLGVDVFFVISGFVITASLAHRLGSYRGPADFLVAFYARRIQRLVPALAVCVAVTALLLCLVNPAPARLLDTGLWALFGLSNISLHNQATDYFGLAADLNPFTHTWSLGIEEQFYLLVPWLYWGSGFGRRGAAGRRRLAIGIAIVSTLSLAAWLVFTPARPLSTYFLLPYRLWELGVGCLLRLLGERLPGPRPPAALALVPLLGCFLLPVARIALAVPAAVACTAALLLLLRPATPIYRLLTTPAMLTVGLMSYSLYLWHWSVLAISRWSVGIHWWTVPFQVLAIVGLAAASSRWIENPLRRHAWSPRRRGTLLIGGGVLVGTALPLAALAGPLSGVLYAGNREQARLASFSRATAAAGTTISEQRCQRLGFSTLRDCVAPPRLPDQPTLLLMGDSHAQHLLPLMGSLREREGIGLIAFAPGGGSFPPLAQKERWNERDLDAGTFLRLVTPSLRRGDVLVLSSHLRGPLQAVAADPAPGADLHGPIRRWGREVAAIARDLAPAGVNVLVVLPLPAFDPPAQPVPIEACLSTWFRPRPPEGCPHHLSAPRPPLRLGTDLVADLLQRELGGAPNVRLFDGFDAFCPPDHNRCRARRGEKILFRDDNHLSTEGSLHLLESLQAFMLDQGWLSRGRRPPS